MMKIVILIGFWMSVTICLRFRASDSQEKSVFRLFQPPEAKNDPDTENTKQPDFDKNCLVYSVSGSFLVSGGQKTRKSFLMSSKNPFFSFFSLQRPKMPWHRKYQTFLIKIGLFCIFCVRVIFGLWRLKNPKNGFFDICKVSRRPFWLFSRPFGFKYVLVGVPNESWQCPLQYRFPAIKVWDSNLASRGR